MKKNKNISDETLRELFKGMNQDEPASDFMENLLQRIESESIKTEKIKNIWIILGQIAAGIFGIFILPVLTIYLCMKFIPGFIFSFSKININFDINVISIGLSVLILLIIDTLLRMNAAKRIKNN